MRDPGETAVELTREFERRYGDRLRCVLLYGSVARGEAVEGVSDINVLVLLDRIDATALEIAAPVARRWVQAGNTAPLFMTWGEWRRAADAFAIEVADMRDAHRILHGTDPLDGLVVERRALRLQAERELRGKIVQLREGLLLSAGHGAEIGRLLLVALPSFVTYLRAALRLAGRPVPDRGEAVIVEGARLIGADPRPFLEAWTARRERRPLSPDLHDPLVTGYYAVGERTAHFVDDLPEEGIE